MQLVSLPPPPPPPPKRKEKKLHRCFQLLLAIKVVPREIEDNGYAKLWG